MKDIIIFFLALLTFFSVKEKKMLISKQSKNTPSYANLGQASNCKARNVNNADAQAYLPDTNCTPGVINLDVNQKNIYSTICVSGYTKTIRPSASYTDKLKIQQIKEYGYADTNTSDYEEDHVISLELGGSPSDPKNLWPEPHPSLNEKDKVENYLHKQVCNGIIRLSQAQNEIAQNWYAIYEKIK